jgi:hypothetical protein
MLKGRQIRTGTVHFALEVPVPKRRQKQLVQACGNGRTAGTTFLEPVESDTTVTCGKCVHRPAKPTTQPDPTPEENTMTTTVKRGAGRPAAAEKRSRHAQRTPLPPKDGSQDSTPAEVETKTRRTRKAVTGSEESPNPTRSARKGTAKAAERAPKRVAERPATTPKGRPSASAKTLPEDFPGRSKAMRLLDGPAQEAGWVGSVKIVDAKTGACEVSVSKGDETMTWFAVDGKQDPAQAPRYTDGRRTVQMKNIAAILAQATGERAWIKPESAKAPRKSSAKRAPVSDVPQRQPLPFDAAEASEREVATQLRGKTITWQNQISKAVESAVIATRAKIRLEEHPQTGERIVTFNDPVNTGTRSVRLSGILTVK